MDNKKGYLVLTRRKDESIIIGDNIEILVVGFRRNFGDSAPEPEVALGISASKEIQVHRKEVWEKMQKQKNAPEHDCLQYAVYRINKFGSEIANCELCYRRWTLD